MNYNIDRNGVNNPIQAVFVKIFLSKISDKKIENTVSILMSVKVCTWDRKRTMFCPQEFKVYLKLDTSFGHPEWMRNFCKTR